MSCWRTRLCDLRLPGARTFVFSHFTISARRPEETAPRLDAFLWTARCSCCAFSMFASASGQQSPGCKLVPMTDAQGHREHMGTHETVCGQAHSHSPTPHGPAHTS